ncbi:hypothetical protein [Pseudomonas putida]|uniref:hypothetical protein n=1 Tax=Pseudomonas putida TaxID=303 RepID=UPI002B24A50E|nr:hypothetical protein [Pseudomonas putida]
MKSFIDRNPKERAVEKAFAELARNGYESCKPDPADKIFEVADRLRREAVLNQRAREPGGDSNEYLTFTPEP